jgi:hypothetical protein
MGVNHGGTNPPRIGSGGTLIQVVPPDFCHVSKFQALAMDSSPPDFSPDLRHWLDLRLRCVIVRDRNEVARCPTDVRLCAESESELVMRFNRLSSLRITAHIDREFE